MALTVGAIILLVGLIFLIYYGYGVSVKKSSKPGEQNLHACSLCQQKFKRSELVERLVGDSKLFYFCEECVNALHEEFERSKGEKR